MTNPGWMLRGCQMNPPDTTEYIAQVCLRFPRLAWEEVSQDCQFCTGRVSLQYASGEPRIVAFNHWSIPMPDIVEGQMMAGRRPLLSEVFPLVVKMGMCLGSWHKAMILNKSRWVTTETFRLVPHKWGATYKGRAEPSPQVFTTLLKPSLLSQRLFGALALEIHRVGKQMNEPCLSSLDYKYSLHPSYLLVATRKFSAWNISLFQHGSNLGRFREAWV